MTAPLLSSSSQDDNVFGHNHPTITIVVTKDGDRVRAEETVTDSDLDDMDNEDTENLQTSTDSDFDDVDNEDIDNLQTGGQQVSTGGQDDHEDAGLTKKKEVTKTSSTDGTNSENAQIAVKPQTTEVIASPNDNDEKEIKGEDLMDKD